MVKKMDIIYLTKEELKDESSVYSVQKVYLQKFNMFGAESSSTKLNQQAVTFFITYTEPGLRSFCET